ncbi:MAG: transglutaminase domain-containing protein [Desulfobacterales bacterium]|nr:MAG: transglutaminase domain-containing protein [Desulfobacterales bacterium]
MALHQTKPFWIAGTCFGCVFAILLMMRLDWFNKIFSRPQTLSPASVNAVFERDTWMNIFHNERKIGFSHTRFATEDGGYRLQETVFMRINTMGMIQDINLSTRGRLNPDFTLLDFDFEINSGRSRFLAKGSVADQFFNIETQSGGSRRTLTIEVETKPYLLAGIVDAVAITGLEPGAKFAFAVFDPATLGDEKLAVEVLGPEEILIGGDTYKATRISLNFKGATQWAWIGEDGDLLRQKGLLGIRLERTTHNEALHGLTLEASRDLSLAASVASNASLANLDRLTVLQVELSGIALDQVHLQGGRQNLNGRILTIQKELTADLPAELPLENLPTVEKIFLNPSPFIQSDHAQIRRLAREIVGADSPGVPLERARKLVDWVHRNIEKRPVLSLPDALSTLENRRGDCNEHAVLLAALARAAGIPSRVEAGLVYLNDRFYYHAWNLLYLGRWITADALFGQLPADVSHIRFTTGAPQQQLDIIGIIGKVRIRVIEE